MSTTTKPSKSTTSGVQAELAVIKAEKLEIEEKISDYQNQLDAIGASQAVIEFTVDGTIVTANDNFLNALNYSLDEIQGKHHRMFVEDAYAASPAYTQFWADLSNGKSQEGEFLRIGKGGKEVWIQARYSALVDDKGKTYKVVKYASEITEQKKKNLDFQNQLKAIGETQAVIEFTVDGTIVTANDNFLNALNYRLDEIQGKHHRMFVEDAYAASPAYTQFWADLNNGQSQEGEFLRIGKGGKEVWIQARYSALVDDKGKTYKVVKYASEITEQKKKNLDFQNQLEAIGAAQAVIEFEPDGTIITANDNFLNAVEYTLREIQGDHHRKFVSEEYAASAAYRDFWAKLGRGESQDGEFQRFGKGGKEIWLQARYSALIDDKGKTYKVVKYASDITAAVTARAEAAENEERERQAQEELRNKVDQLLTVVNAAASGDLTEEVTVSGEDAVGELAGGLSKMITDLREIIGQVVEGAAQFTEGSRVIAESAQTLAQGSQTQSASVEEMSASIEELTRSIEAVKDNAGEANQVAKETSELAEEGGSAVQKSVEAMDLIKTSSEQISEIIQVISEIASQTNLLALNAAIEAARAGEHGLGFAVVADEVRKLAERSSEAAKEISSLIKESTQRVEDGATLSEQTGAALEKIIQGVEGTANKIGEIAEATVEQSANATEVANAIQSISTVTEQSAAGSEEMASSSEELGAQASGLSELVANFKISNE